MHALALVSPGPLEASERGRFDERAIRFGRGPREWSPPKVSPDGVLETARRTEARLRERWDARIAAAERRMRLEGIAEKEIEISLSAMRAERERSISDALSQWADALPPPAEPVDVPQGAPEAFLRWARRHGEPLAERPADFEPGLAARLGSISNVAGRRRLVFMRAEPFTDAELSAAKRLGFVPGAMRAAKGREPVASGRA